MSTELPHYSLRHELVEVLVAHQQAADPGMFPPLPPSGVLEILNHIGPRLGVEALPLIEFALDGLWQVGLIGRIPAIGVGHAPFYMSRGAALLAIRWNAPVILLPLRDPTGLCPTPIVLVPRR